MDASHTEYVLLVFCPQGIQPDSLDVDLSAEYDRMPHPNSLLEASIETTWLQRISSQPYLYNQSKYRFAGCTITEEYEGKSMVVTPREWDGNEQESVAVPCAKGVRLLLGLTDYKGLIGTNLNPLWHQFLTNTTDPYLIQSRHLACPLGNMAIVSTSDGKVVVLNRGANVGEFPLCPVFPGGHSEPSDVGINGHSELSDELLAAIAADMFLGVIREVVEETGIHTSHLPLSGVRFIGVSMRRTNHRAITVFTAQCTADSTQVQEMYKMAEDKFESTSLECLSVSDMLAVSRSMPGCHRGGARLYELWLTYNAVE